MFTFQGKQSLLVPCFLSTSYADHAHNLSLAEWQLLSLKPHRCTCNGRLSPVWQWTEVCCTRSGVSQLPYPTLFISVAGNAGEWKPSTQGFYTQMFSSPSLFSLQKNENKKQHKTEARINKQQVFILYVQKIVFHSTFEIMVLKQRSPTLPRTQRSISIRLKWDCGSRARTRHRT